MPMRMLYLSLAVLASTAPAQTVRVDGAGTASCGKWLAARGDDNTRFQLRQWVSGFVAGMNWAHLDKQASTTDLDVQAAFVDLYCTNNPLHGVVHAAAALVQEAGGPPVSFEWKR